jgi:hypothetical protein
MGKARLTEAQKASARERMRKWRIENPERTKLGRRNAFLKRTYGIDAEQYDALLSAQGFKCLICSTETPGGKGHFHVDHCHADGRIRGLLCHNCNVGLGNFKDNPATLTRAIEYLKCEQRV